MRKVDDVTESLPLTMRAGRMPRVGVLINPLSGKYRKGRGATLDVLAKHHQVLRCEVQTPGDVALALADFAGKKVDVVAIHGGDGTVQSVLTALFSQKAFETPPLLAPLAAGTTNMTATDVGTGGNPVRQLQRLLLWAQGRAGEGRIVKRPVMRVDCGPSREQLFGMFFSAAGIVQVTQARWNSRDQARLPGMRGGLGTAATIGRFVTGLAMGRRVIEPSRIQVQLDSGRVEESEYLALLITSHLRLALGIQPYWGEGPGSLRYTAIAYQPQHLLRVAPALLRGKPRKFLHPEFGYTSHNVNEVRLWLNDNCALDGEILATEAGSPVVITGGQDVCFVCP